MMKNPASPVATQGHSKTYVLGMFPYPSGEGLHVGHVRIFTACDVMARYFRMTRLADGESRREVLSPMGWDAFGLPAENAAIKFKKIPQEMVPHNYANFRRQMEDLSLSFDWERELATSDPAYYAITQWIFLQIYNKGLVYREKVAINWCPKCLTGLANEEVLGDGTHERCGTAVGKKLLPQWVMRITEYAERLLNDLDHSECPPIINSPMCTNGEHKTLDWPKGILEMQRNWIGKKEGMRVTFKITNLKFSNSQIGDLEIFTTRVDTINGVTFVVVAPELIKDWMDRGFGANDEVKKYVETSLQKSEQSRLEGEREKTGVDTGLTVVNPYNQEKIPVWVADYALANVGTGGVMGVPHYDERDKAFAIKFGLPIKEIECDETILEKLEKMGVAKKETTYHLRDWVFSRQRYWGEPIPLVYCEHCAQNQVKHSRSEGLPPASRQGGHSGSVGNGEQEFDIVEKDGQMMAVVPVPEDQLPLTLPKLTSYEPTETGESPLAKVSEWVNTKCPQCGGPATRETDTMPNWAGSCWYFLAFAFWGSKMNLPARSDLVPLRVQDQTLGSQPYSDWWFKEALPKIKEWLPVDWYLGGAEHAVLHLLYARFWVKVLQDLKLLDFPEPFLRLRSVGMVLAEDGKKMSKSLGNVVNPDDMVAKYGSDAVRMYEMFMGPWEQSIAWDSSAISGQVRFLGRVRETVKRVGEKTTPIMAAKLKTLVARVEEGVLKQKFNTAIAGLMEFVNSWRVEGMVLAKEHVEMFASLLSLFAPITAGEIWKQMEATHSRSARLAARQVGALHSGSVGGQWPDVSKIESFDDAQDLSVTIAVQVNGKLRATVEMGSQQATNQVEVMKTVMDEEKIKKWITGEVKKMIFVPGKLINLVI